MKMHDLNTNKTLKEFYGRDEAWKDARDNYQEATGKKFDAAPRETQDLYYKKALQHYGLTINRDGHVISMESKETIKALAEHVKKQVPLCDSIFRYQSEAYFDTFTKAKKLREAGSLPELDWESEEMLATDIGESVVLKNGERVWLDVPYLEEAVEEAQEGMIGEPDAHYDAEERKQAYNDLQDALGQCNSTEAEYVKDGSCPECPNVEDDEDCYGFGNYGCDDGILTYNGDDVSWKEIKDHDERQAQRQSAEANYPGDEEVIKQAARMMPNMDDPRMIVQQIRTDYPQLGRAKASDLAGKAKQIAFPESVEIDRIKNLAGLNELKDERTDIDKIADLLKDAIGSDARGEDMYELYAELESMDSEKADEVKLIAKEIYGVRLEEGKSPHKKGTKKYKKHMAAMHAEDLEEKALKDVGGDDIVTVKMGGVDREFIRKGDEWESTDQVNYPMKFKVGTPTHKKLLNIQRKKQMARSTPSAQARRKLKVMASEAEYQGKKVQLNKPKRGGSKKYYVYVKSKKGNVKKISFGDPGLKTKSGNKARAKSFAARHNCEKKNDKTKAGYWACRLPRYGLVKGGKWW
jgi:hypothetical protein